MCDLEFFDFGGIVAIDPRTNAGREWVENNLNFERWQADYIGDDLTRVYIERNLSIDILQGAVDEGLKIKGITDILPNGRDANEN